MNESFGKDEKLKGKIMISRLFREGRSFSEFPIRVIFITPGNSLVNNKAGFSVPKRNFKNSVDRNQLKRLMREGYRKNKYLINKESKFAMMFIFTGKKKEDYHRIFSIMQVLLKKLSDSSLKDSVPDH